MTSVETNVNAYDTGHKPYKNDPNRGKWNSKWDFYFACIGHAFGLRNFCVLPIFTLFHGGLYCIPPFIISILLFCAPIFLIQSFLGQFSSTGYLSAFRISPLFKGIGYVILALNFSSLTYISSAAGMTLLYLFHFFDLNKPWMKCDNSWNTANCSVIFNTNWTTFGVLPMIEYSEKVILRVDYDNLSDISWPVIGATLVTWIITAACLLKGVAIIGKIIRYSTIIILTILTLLFVRVMFLENVKEDLADMIKRSSIERSLVYSFIGSPILGGLTLGSGWGMVMTMSSFNRFKEDIEKISYAVPFTTAGLIIISGLVTYIIDNNLQREIGFTIQFFDEHGIEMIFFGFPYFFGTIEASQMWLVLLYLMLFLCELNTVILLTFSILTALYDEYEVLRNFKYHLTGGLCGILFLLSGLFATTNGTEIYKLLFSFGNFMQMFVCFCEILMIIWVYGRLRFLRDIQFMLSRPFYSWKFYIFRFVSPIYIFFLGTVHLVFSWYSLVYTSGWIVLPAFVIKCIPWICIPIYAIYKLMKITGTFMERLKKSVQPTDWYPADVHDRQKYETTLGTSDISQQLLEMREEEI